MSKTLIYIGLIIFLGLLAGCDQNSQPLMEQSSQKWAGSGSEARENEWALMSDEDLWEVILQSESTAIVGIKPAGSPRGVVRGRVLTPRTLLGLVEQVQGPFQALSYTHQLTFEQIPAVVLRIETLEAFIAIRANPHVDYIEPIKSQAQVSHENTKSSPGTGCDPVSNFIPNKIVTNSGDDIYTYFKDMGVINAWNKGNGNGVTVAVLGTGMTDRSPQLTDQFTHGDSGFRSITSTNILDEFNTTPQWFDNCTHETKIVSTIAAPRDGVSMTGIAYRSSIYALKTDDDVVLGYPIGGGTDNTNDVIAVLIALQETYPGGDYPSDIVNMAFGTPQFYSPIEDAIYIGYHTHGMTYVAASGGEYGISCNPNGSATFPAELPEVIAVAALLPNGDVFCGNSRATGQPDATAAVKFTVPVDEPFGMDALSTSNQYLRTGGSSFTTGVVSGMLAVMYDAGYTRDDAYQRLLSSRDTLWGDWRVPNVAHAMDMISKVYISGPTTITSSGTYNYTSSQDNAPSGANLSYAWTGGSTAQNGAVPLSRTPGPTTYRDITLTVTQDDPFFYEPVLPSVTSSFTVELVGLMSDINGPICMQPNTTRRYTAQKLVGPANAMKTIQVKTPCGLGEFKNGEYSNNLGPTCGQWSDASNAILPATNTTYLDKTASSDFEVRTKTSDGDITHYTSAIKVSVFSSCSQ